MSQKRYPSGSPAIDPTVPVVMPPADYVEDLPVWHVPMTEHVQSMISAQLAEMTGQRQAVEDARAIKRNRNRFLTLAGALVISFVITYVLKSGILGPTGPALAPYAFCITILLDSSFTLYAYLRRY